jgi:hypothetical protein
VAVSLAGGRQYYVISKSAVDMDGCKGKTLVSDHTDDTRFVERVVAAGKFTLADFTVVESKRSLQTITKVINDEAVCALIVDAQLAELSHLEGAAGLRTVWKERGLAADGRRCVPGGAGRRTQAVQGASRQPVRKTMGRAPARRWALSRSKAASVTDYATVVAAYGK